MSRPTHQNKEIEAALRDLDELGWVYKAPGKSAHCWGRMYCPQNDRTGCKVSVWSTPASPADHARHLRGHGKRCAHEGLEASDEKV